MSKPAYLIGLTPRTAKRLKWVYEGLLASCREAQAKGFEIICDAGTWSNEDGTEVGVCATHSLEVTAVGKTMVFGLGCREWDAIEHGFDGLDDRSLRKQRLPLPAYKLGLRLRRVLKPRTVKPMDKHGASTK